MTKEEADILQVSKEYLSVDYVEVGKVTACRTVTAGGAYTVGAWKDVFLNLASDVVTDLKKQLLQ